MGLYDRPQLFDGTGIDPQKVLNEIHSTMPYTPPPPPPPPKRGLLEDAATHFAIGANKYGAMPIAGLTEIAGRATGIKPLEDLGKTVGDNAEQWIAEKEREDPSQKFRDIANVGDAATWAREQITEFVPQALIGLATGGAGAAAGRAAAGGLVRGGAATVENIAGKKAIQTAIANQGGRALAAEEIAALAANRAGVAGAITAAGVGSTGMETASIYRDQEEGGKDIGRAALYGTAAGILDTAFPAFLIKKTGLTKLMPGMGKIAGEADALLGKPGLTIGQKLANTGKIAGLGIAEETPQEGIQTILENIGANKQVYSDEVNKAGGDFSAFLEVAGSKGISAAVHPEAWNDIVESMAAGGLIGGVMGGGSAGAGHIADSFQSKNNQEQPVAAAGTPPAGEPEAGGIPSPGIPPVISGTPGVLDDSGQIPDFAPPTAPTGTLGKALIAGGIATPLTTDNLTLKTASPSIYTQFATNPFAGAPIQASAIAGPQASTLLDALQSRPDEMTAAKQWATEQIRAGRTELMQNRGISDEQQNAKILAAYRTSQEKANAAGDILPQLPATQGAGTLERDNVGVPALPAEVQGGRGGDLQPGIGGITNEVSSVRKEASGAPEVPPVRGQSESAKVTALQREKEQLLSDPRNRGIAGEATYTPQTTQRLNEINAEIRRIEADLPASPASAETGGMMVKTVTTPSPRQPVMPDTNKDNLQTAIAKLGGIKIEQVDDGPELALDFRHQFKKLKQRQRVVLHPAGKSLHDMRLALIEQGYLPETAEDNDLKNMLQSAARGIDHNSIMSANAGTDEYQAQMDRYAAMIEDMTDEEYADLVRNQWLEEQAELLADVSDLQDGYLDDRDTGVMTAADWQAVAAEFKEAIDAEITGAGIGAEDQGQVRASATGTAEGVSGVSKGNDAGQDQAAGKADRWTEARKRHLTKRIAATTGKKERARLQKILDGLKNSGTIEATGGPTNDTRTEETAGQGGTNPIETAQDVLAAVHGTEPGQGPQHLTPTAFVEKELAKRPAESKALLAWAKENNLLRDDSDFTDRYIQQFKDTGTSLSGGEHDVIFNGTTVEKRNNLPEKYHHNYSELFHRIAEWNKLFPATKLDLLGIIDDNGFAKPVFRQAAIEGRDATDAEVTAFLTGTAGMEALVIRGKTVGFRIPGTGKIVTDTFGANTKIDSNGDVVPIDYIIFDGQRATDWLARMEAGGMEAQEKDAAAWVDPANVDARGALGELADSEIDDLDLDAAFGGSGVEKAAETGKDNVIPFAFGEKIGGARKDTAEKGTGTAKKAKSDDGTPTWRKRFKVADSVRNPGTFSIIDTKEGRYSFTSRSQTFVSEAAAEQAIPVYAVAKTHQITQNATGGWEIYKRVGERKRIKVVNQDFASREEALQHMALNAEKLLETKTTFGEEILPVPEIAVRKGAQRRTEPATPQMFMETFAPRGIEFGNWNNQEERQQIMDHAYDGLLDLAEVLNVPPKALMLDGDLAIAFGARGQGLSGAKAHYEPDFGVINLTKMKGAGSLAHEWFHALDHYLGRQDTKASSEKETDKKGNLVYKTKGATDFLSNGISYKSKVRPEIQEAYKQLIQGMFRKAQQYVEDTQKADKFVGTARENLQSSLAGIRKNLSDDLAEQYTWRKVKRGLHPASAEQLLEFDRLATILLEGGDLQTEWRANNPDAPARSRGGMTGRRTNDTLEGLSRILKAVRGSSGFNTEGKGTLDRLRADMGLYEARLTMLKDAEGQTEKTKQIPTSFAMEAKKMDQARTSDYWSEPHEMAARAFAAYVEDKVAEQGGQSDFIVYHAHGGILVPMIDGFIARPYPEGEERTAINAAFEGFVSQMETKETDKGVALYEHQESYGVQPSPRNRPIPPTIEPVIQSYFNNIQLRKHPDYSAAKAGDVPAAARLVQDMVKPETVDALKNIVKPGDMFVAAHAIEASGMNAIPEMLAHYYAATTGGEVNTDSIIQVNKVYHTGAGMMERMLNRPRFAGEVVKGARYILVDDVTTSGGTFADLSDYIIANGGQVVSVVSLTNAMRGTRIVPVRLVIKTLERRFGNEIREIFNIEPAALTAAEAGYLIGFKDAGTLRNRSIKAAQERDTRLRTKGVRTSEAQDGLVVAGTVKEAANVQFDLFTTPAGTTKRAVPDNRRNRGVAWYASEALPDSVRNIQTEIASRPTGTFTSSITHVRSAADAAAFFVDLADNAKEQAMLLVLDKSGRPLTLVDVGTGTLNQALLHPRNVIGAALNIPGAARVWIAHNHPTGDPAPSKEDIAIGRRFTDLAEGSGLIVAGNMEIGEDGQYMTVDLEPGSPTPQAAGGKNIPILNQKIRLRVDSNAERITSPGQLLEVIDSLGLRGKSGVIMLDGKNRVVGVVDMSVADMEVLRTGSQDKGSGLLMKALGRTNAAAMVVLVNDNGVSQSRALQNIVNFGAVAGVQVLDAVTPTDGSLLEKGYLPEPTGSFYSNPMFDPQLIVASLSGLKQNLQEDIPKLVNLGQRIIHDGAAKYQQFVSGMKRYLGEKWAAFKNLTFKVYHQAKEAYSKSPLGNAIGSVGVDIKAGAPFYSKLEQVVEQKMGGEGLKTLYDKTLPALFKKYGKEKAVAIEQGDNPFQQANSKIVNGPVTAYIPVTSSTPDSYARFALQSPPQSGIPAGDVKSWVSTLPIAGHVAVWQHPGQLRSANPSAHTQIARAGVNPDRIQAMEFEGELFVFAGNIPTMQRAKALVIGHELAHAGQTEKITDFAVDWFRRTSDKKSEQARAAHALLQQTAERYGYNLDNEKQYRRAVKEATAAYAEQAAEGKLPMAGLMQRLFMYVKHWLRQKGLISHVSDNELALAVAEMLRLGEKRLSTGPGGGIGVAQLAMEQKVVVNTPGNLKKLSLAELSTRVKEIARSLFAGKTVVNVSDGSEIIIPWQGIKHTFAGGPSRNTMLASLKLDEVVVNGVPESGKMADSKGRRNVLGAYYYITPVEIDGALVNVRVVVREHLDGKRYYDHYEIENAPQGISGEPSLSEEGQGSHQPFTGRSSDNSIDVPDENVKANFALAEQVSAINAAIPAVVTYAKDNWASLVNPLDFSRSAHWFDNWTPDVIKAGFGYFFNNPFFEGLRDAAKKVFVDEGADRELNRMSLMLQFFGYTSGKKDTRSKMEQLKDFVTKWHSGIESTNWEKLNLRYLKMPKEQQATMDVLTTQGDADNTYYSSYRNALLNRKIKAAGLSEEAFTLYKDVYTHMQTVSRIREQQIERMLLEAGVSKAEVDKRIADYRNETREVAGWMTRNHGEGNYVTAVHHVIKDLKFSVRDIKGEAQQAFLPYYPGIKVMAEIEKLAKGIDATVTLTGKGAVVITAAKGQRLDGFMEAAAGIVPKLKEKLVDEPHRLQKIRDKVKQQGATAAILDKIDKRIEKAETAAKDPRLMVMVYSRRHIVKGSAAGHADVVKADLKKHMPEGFREREEYITSVAQADTLNEEIFQNMPNDIAMQAGLEKAFEASLKHGEIGSDELEALKAKLIQDTAEVLLGRAAGKYQIRRAPYLIEGYDTQNVMAGYQDYMTSVAGMLSKAEYGAKQFKHLTEAGIPVKPWAYKYVFDSLRNEGMADRISGNARAFVSLWYMGLKPASALINATQIYTLGVAEIGKIVGKGESATVRVMKAQKDALNGKLTMDEKEIFESAIMFQQEAATALSQITGHNEGGTGKASRILHNVTGKAMALFQNIEVLNRKTMILAAYRILRDTNIPVGVIDHAALKEALEINNSVNFDQGRHNLPGWARKPLGRSLYALQSFTWNNLNWIFKHATSGERRDMIALLRYAGMLMLIGGAAALGGGDELDKLYRKLRGKSLLLEAKEWTHKHGKQYGTLGEMADAFAWHGMAGLAGLNISNSMRLQIPIASQMLGDATMPEAFGGVWSGLAKKAWLTSVFLGKGDIYRAAESASPEAIAGGMRAYRQYDKGMTTLRGRPVFDEDGQPLKYSASDAMLRVAGFQPAGQSRRMGVVMAGNKISSWWKDEREDLLAELRITKAGERKDIMLKIMRFNRDVRQSQAWGKVNIIDKDTLDRALTFKPNKKDVAWQKNRLD